MSEVFKAADIYLAGYRLSGDFNQIALEYGAESLEATVFGNDTRVMKGGLKTSRVSGAGFYQAGVGTISPVLHDLVGSTDDVLMAFPAAIVEGSTSTGAGFMFKTFTSRYTVGGQVGDLLPFTIEAEGRGAGA